MIPSQLLQDAVSHRGFRPLPGRCIIELDETPTLIGLLHIPDTARGLRAITEVSKSGISGDRAYSGKVLAMTPRKHPKSGEPKQEQFQVGDKVWVMLLMEDLDEKVICTRVERVYAVLEKPSEERCGAYSMYQESGVGCELLKGHEGDHTGAALDNFWDLYT